MARLPEKLVRDRIPEIIEARGERAAIRLVTGPEEYLELLHAKLLEEAAEFRADPSAEEMADIMEVLRALSTAYSLDPADVETVRVAKARERGGFERGYVFTIPSA